MADYEPWIRLQQKLVTFLRFLPYYWDLNAIDVIWVVTKVYCNKHIGIDGKSK